MSCTETLGTSPEVVEEEAKSHELPLTAKSFYEALAEEEKICDGTINDSMNSLLGSPGAVSYDSSEGCNSADRLLESSREYCSLHDCHRLEALANLKMRFFKA